MSLTDPITCALRGHLGGFELDVAFTAPARGVTALFGPSGCGKTTVLRCIAGLHRLDEGRIALGDTVWQDGTLFTPAHRRAIGYVFQEASLFPHLDVRRNLTYGAARAAKAGTALTIAFDEVVVLLGLAALLDRSPAALSGGERQRVAIGRALLSQPRLLLMDEPLSALDALTKDEILPFLERLHAELAIPVIYVTHDLREVERLADTLVLMERGRVIAAGPIAQLQSDPALPLVARRDAAVSLDAVARDYDAVYGLLTLEVPGAQFSVPSGPVPAGEVRRISVKAADVSLALQRPQLSTITNVVPARITACQELTTQEHAVVLGLGVDGSGATLLARVTRRSWDQLGLHEGRDVYAQVKGVALTPRAR